MGNAKKRIAIFASGSGTNAENLIKYFKNSQVIEIALVVCNRPKAQVLLRAKNLGVSGLVINKLELENPTELLKNLTFWKINYIVLAGFLLKIPTALIQQFPQQIINIHPALLPNFGGRGMYGGKVHEAVKASGTTQTGITIHLVNEVYDDGPILFQAICSVTPADTPETIAKKIHELEYTHFPTVVENLILNT
ncbi:UNVERIFIED_CONTAM: hypothetical protein GTU68_059989 [Idotea baltica]|nr:hypothetical protein [Idotea baltica]